MTDAYMQHHAIVATFRSWELARRVFDGLSAYGCKDLVLIAQPAGEFATLFLPPTGRGLGDGYIEDSEMRDLFVVRVEAIRDEFGESSVSWAEVQYGDDELETKIARDSDEWSREVLNV